MKIGNMEVKRVDDNVIVVQEEMENETGCYVSKSSDDSIEGRYLHKLAAAVADAPRLTSNQFARVEHCIQGSISMGRLAEESASKILEILRGQE